MAGMSPRLPSLDPACRILCLALLSPAILLGPWPFAAALALAAGSLVLVSGVKLHALAKEMSLVLAFGLFSAALRIVGVAATDRSAAAIGSGIYACQLASVFLLGRLFYATTSSSEIRDASTRIVRKVPILRAFDIGMYLSLTLGLIPLIFEEWSASKEAARARGLRKRTSLRLQAAFISAFLHRLMVRATLLPESLASRGWTKKRATPVSLWRRRDSWASLLCGMLLAAALLRHV
jgi:energy-coupling factor transporter transmembrane protein EcfT